MPQGQPRHFITEVDWEDRSALCAVDGRVPFVIDNGARRPACSVRRRMSDRIRLFRFRYGITVEEWDAMLIAQSGRCGACNDPLREPCLDHCHSTGTPRGILCPGCNKGIGCFRDDPARLAAAIAYLTGGVSA